jgi:hypothetical protein
MADQTVKGTIRKNTTSKQPKSVLEKQTATTSRWLHTYLSMISFTLLLFFAATGLTLNHADWFSAKPVIKKSTGAMSISWLSAKDTSHIDKLSIVEYLRKTNLIKGAVSDFRIEDEAISISFNGPGYAADASIDRIKGSYKLSETRLGLVAVLNDLHKGRDAGKGWAIVIDASAIFMILVSVTGIIMICFMKKKRLNGLIKSRLPYYFASTTKLTSTSLSIELSGPML